MSYFFSHILQEVIVSGIICTRKHEILPEQNAMPIRCIVEGIWFIDLVRSKCIESISFITEIILKKFHSRSNRYWKSIRDTRKLCQSTPDARKCKLHMLSAHYPWDQSYEKDTWYKWSEVDEYFLSQTKHELTPPPQTLSIFILASAADWRRSST